jgi:hypothetical protein
MYFIGSLEPNTCTVAPPLLPGLGEAHRPRQIALPQPHLDVAATEL